jgi:type II secretory pathway component PulF
MAGDASQSASIKAGAGVAAQIIDGGDTLAAGLRASGAFPKLFTDSIQAAEMAGSLDVELGRWARLETDYAISAQKRAAEVLPKLAYILVVLWIGWEIISFFASYFGQITKWGEM